MAGDFCAVPQFAEMGPTQGANYVCEGTVNGNFKYKQCILNCPDEYDPYEDPIPIDGNTTGDGEIPFPPAEDPTEGGEGEGEEIYACCHPDIELGGSQGAVEGVEACASACAHAACNGAIARFEAMLVDEETWEDCPGQDCEDNVKDSIKHFIAHLKDHFDDCLAATLTPGAGNEYTFTQPPCANGTPVIGCLVYAQLDMSCNSVTIDFNSEDGTCVESPHQPTQPTMSQACVIGGDGGGYVTDDAAVEFTDFSSGSAVMRYFDCGEALCPFVLDGLEVTIRDVEGGGIELSDLEAELVVAAYGQSDGADMEFAPGAIVVRVSGTWTDATGSVPFETLGANVEPAFGSHDNDLLSLGSVTFEAGAYTFVAYVEEAECDDL